MHVFGVGGGAEDLERAHPGHQEDMQTPGKVLSADFNNCDYNLGLRYDQLSVQHSHPPLILNWVSNWAASRN